MQVMRTYTDVKINIKEFWTFLLNFKWCGHLHFQAALAPVKVSLYPVFSYVRQILQFPSNRAEDDLRSKSPLLWQSVRPHTDWLFAWPAVYGDSHGQLYVPFPMVSCMWRFPWPAVCSLSHGQLYVAFLMASSMWRFPWSAYVAFPRFSAFGRVAVAII